MEHNVTYCYRNGDNLISFYIKNTTKQKAAKTKIMSVKEMVNANTTKSSSITRDSVYTVHTNKYIEHLSNKPPPTSMRDRQV